MTTNYSNLTNSNTRPEDQEHKVEMLNTSYEHIEETSQETDYTNSYDDYEMYLLGVELNRATQAEQQRFQSLFDSASEDAEGSAEETYYTDYNDNEHYTDRNHNNFFDDM